jgi:hypothetical protein
MLPLFDYSQPGSNRASALASSYVSQRFTFTCPQEADALTLEPGTELPAIASNTTANQSGITVIPGTTYSSSLRLAAVSRVTYKGVPDPKAVPSTCRLPFQSCDSSGMMTSSSVNLETAVSQASSAASFVKTGGGVERITVTLFTLTAPCVGLSGPRNVTCGPGAYGNFTSFDCPSIRAQPVCTFWREDMRRWSSVGCTVVNVTEDSVVCACTHLTAFAARFAALAADNADTFAVATRLGSADYSKATFMLKVVGSILLVLLASSLFAWRADHRGAELFYKTISQDSEVLFLARIEELKGNAFILDRRLDDRMRAAMSSEAKNGYVEGGKEETISIGNPLMMKRGGSAASSSPLPAPALRLRASPSAARLVDPHSQAVYRTFMNMFDSKRVTAETMGGEAGLRRFIDPTAAASLGQAVQNKGPTGRGGPSLRMLTFTRAFSRPEEATRVVNANVAAQPPNGALDDTKVTLESLEAQGASTCSRAWHLRAFIARIWVLRTVYTHNYFSIYSRYDPRFSRMSRLLLLASVLLGCVFVNAFLYALRKGRPGMDLPPLEIVEVIVIAFLAAAIQMPIHALLEALLNKSGRTEFSYR